MIDQLLLPGAIESNSPCSKTCVQVCRVPAS